MALIPIFDLCINITCKSFEGAAYDTITGNFDGQGLSVGILQFNLGQGTFQNYILNHINPMSYDFPCSIVPLIGTSGEQAVNWAKDVMLDGNGQIKEDWKQALKIFLTKPEIINLQKKGVDLYFHRAKEICGYAGFKQDNRRAMAWAFDVAVQNWSFAERQEFPNIDQARNILGLYSKDNHALWIEDAINIEQAKLIALTHYRCIKAKKEWRLSIFARKATIIMGHGFVNKTKWDFKGSL